MFRATYSPVFRSTFWLFHLLIFLLTYLNLLYMFRATNSPVFRSTFWIFQVLVFHRSIRICSACFGRQTRPSSGVLFDFSTYWSFYWSIWICSACFGRQTRPSSGALFYFSTYWFFIDLYEFTLHVSGDKLARLQEHFWLFHVLIFLLMYLNLLYMFRAKAVYMYSQKVLLKMGEFVARNM